MCMKILKVGVKKKREPKEYKGKEGKEQQRVKEVMKDNKNW